MIHIEVRDGNDGERTFVIECDDRIPGEEVEPWLVAFRGLIQASGRLLIANDPGELEMAR